MSAVIADHRRRLASIVRRSDCDLAEAALLIAAEADPTVAVDGALLRIDALADGLRTRGFASTDAMRDAAALATYLGDDLGFVGDDATYHDPANALLSHVLERRRGLPITLSVLYVAIARRVRIPAFGIAVPGHFLTGIGGRDRPVILDPFDRGRVIDVEEVADRIHEATAGRLSFRRAMLRPAPPAMIVRRILNNLTRDYSAAGDSASALWTVELKHLLPNALPDDHRVRGELLVGLGRYGEAAAAFERYLELVGPTAEDAEEVRARAVRARATLN